MTLSAAYQAFRLWYNRDPGQRGPGMTREAFEAGFRAGWRGAMKEASK